MEYKLFGLGGFPGDRFRKGLKALFALTQRDWEVVENWFLTTESSDPQDAVSSPAFIASALTPDQATGSIEVLQFILEAWHRRGLDLQAIQRDLMLLGLTPEEIERLASLLERIGHVKKKSWASYMRSQHENAVLPTLEDIDMVCDLRPFFEDYVYPMPETEIVQHKSLLGFTYMILAELKTEDSAGRKQRLAFQMTENTLRDLGVAIRRAQEQLAILKDRTRELSKEGQ